MQRKTAVQAKAMIGILAALGLMASTVSAMAESALDTALAEGAERLDADQLEEQFTGKTGTWVAPSGDMKIEIYYGESNDLHGEQVDGDWSATGYYGIADDNSICISWDGQDEGRLRCLEAVVADGQVTKFNADGSLNGSYEGFEKGKSF